MDFFQNKVINELSSFKQYLLRADFENIPRSEGIYKNKYLNAKNNKLLITTTTFKSINNYLITKNIDSDKLFIIIEFKKSLKNKKASLTIKVKNDLETKITFRQCENMPCIINISRLPLFYKNRQIESLSTDSSNQLKYISFFKITNDSDFW